MSGLPLSWCCFDCGYDTAPGLPSRMDMRRNPQMLSLTVKHQHDQAYNSSEVYQVHDAVWQESGVAPNGGCLCINCLERRIGRKLTANDFVAGHPFNGEKHKCLLKC